MIGKKFMLLRGCCFVGVCCQTCCNHCEKMWRGLWEGYLRSWHMIYAKKNKITLNFCSLYRAFSTVLVNDISKYSLFDYVCFFNSWILGTIVRLYSLTPTFPSISDLSPGFCRFIQKQITIIFISKNSTYTVSIIY